VGHAARRFDEELTERLESHLIQVSPPGQVPADDAISAFG
jgi:hypothetical protein